MASLLLASQRSTKLAKRISGGPCHVVSLKQMGRTVVQTKPKAVEAVKPKPVKKNPAAPVPAAVAVEVNVPAKKVKKIKAAAPAAAQEPAQESDPAAGAADNGKGGKSRRHNGPRKLPFSKSKLCGKIAHLAKTKGYRLSADAARVLEEMTFYGIRRLIQYATEMTERKTISCSLLENALVALATYPCTKEARLAQNKSIAEALAFVASRKALVDPEGEGK